MITALWTHLHPDEVLCWFSSTSKTTSLAAMTITSSYVYQLPYTQSLCTSIIRRNKIRMFFVGSVSPTGDCVIGKTSHYSHACVQHWTTTGYSTSSQTVQISSRTSSSLVLNNGAPQGCVLSPSCSDSTTLKGLKFNPCVVKW